MTPDEHHHNRRWSILLIIGIAQLMVVLDATIVTIALPSAQKALHFSTENRQWVVTAYALAFGSLLLLGGRIGDFFGRKWTFVAGLAGFAVASAVGGAAQSFGMLVAARAVQGAFGALLAPAALSLLTTTFTDGGERAKAFGIYGAIAGSGASIGLLLGGLLTSVLDWRYTMFVNLIFAAIAIAGAVTLLRHDRPAARPRIDIPGVLTAGAGLFSLVYGFNHAQTSSWGNPVTIAFLVAAVLMLVAFVAIEARSASPLLPLRVVTDRNRGAAFLAVAITSAAMFGVFLFLSYWLQQNLRLSPIMSGVAFLPLTIVVMIVAVVGQTRLVPRFGPRPLVAVGMLVAMVGMLLLTRLGPHSGYAPDVLPTLILMGFGMGLIFAPSMATATLGVLPSDAGVASATVNTMQQVGGSVGTAVLSTIATSSLGRVPTPVAVVHGYTLAFGASAGLFALGAIVAMLLFTRGVRAAAPSGEPVAI
ncbi:MAG TPA: MFS transporter [Solirubrobacteraceae bacterium]|jgi:EmrB/QacA subfamily drug resistance transporter|nr:MFS transporter [Solirubrobacteraceae bacterium]